MTVSIGADLAATGWEHYPDWAWQVGDFPAVPTEAVPRGRVELGVGEAIRLPIAHVVHAGEPLRFRIAASAETQTVATWRFCILYSIGAEDALRECVGRPNGEAFVTAGAWQDSYLTWVDGRWVERN